MRDINAPQLPDFGYVFERPGGCAFLGGSDWGVNATGTALDGQVTLRETVADPRAGEDRGTSSRGALSSAEIRSVEAAFAAQGKPWRILSAVHARGGLRIERYKTAQEFETQSAATTTEISHHSAIVLDQNASCYATAS